MKNKINISSLDASFCTGCGVCTNSCPAKAIHMEEDADGFRIPIVAEEKCINCKDCVRICPALSLNNNNVFTPAMYAVRASDSVRAVSSSGGVFSLLAEYIFGLGGCVCGAAFDDNMNLKHRMATDEDELYALRGSKYLQSDTGNIYIQVKAALKERKPVLFTGTPCQVAAIKNYIGEDENLYTADILCHGVPSQKSFDRYLTDVAQGKKVVGAEFRNKKNGWNAEHIIVHFADGSEYDKSLREGNMYVKAFLSNMILRKSCEKCSFSEFPRHGDLSMGDFWGIGNFDKAQNDGKGTSIVFINNEKGMILAENAVFPQSKTKRFAFTDKMPNRVHGVFKASEKRERLLKLLKNHAFSKSVQYVIEGKFDVGLVSNYNAVNFGGSLTQYALYNVLEDMGYSTLMIDRPADAFGRIPTNVHEACYLRWPYPKYALAKQYPTKEDMRELNKYCDSFVVGSDQLFQNTLFNALGGIYTLDWVENTKRKIAYATSFGFDYVWGKPEQLAEMGYFMQQFDAFSVREDSGVNVAKNSFGVDAVHVLDPVFLCDSAYYDELISHSERKIEDDYISSYLLDPTQEKKDMLAFLREKLKMRVEVFSELDRNIQTLSEFGYLPLKIEERLQSIKNAKFFLCDSFHGTCFAILYNVPFISIVNKERGGARFGSLLRYFGLENRMVESFEEMASKPELLEPIDFRPVNERLRQGREFGRQWLREALHKEPKKGASIYDILMARLAERDRKIEQLSSVVRKLCRDKNMLQFAQNIDEYFVALKENKGHSIYIVAVKDTPGISVTDQTAQQLKESLGIRQNMVQSHWKSYLAIVDGGKIIIEELSDNRIDRTLKVEEFQLRLSSAGFNVGNVAKIEVNGIDYALNRRGFNIVAIDKEEGSVCDSACLDLHLKQYSFYHRVIT